jgi:hypothetical protein
MRWFIPSWNGDLRLEPDPKDPALTILSIVKPTTAEIVTVNELGKIFHGMGWLDGWETFEKERFQREKRFTVKAPLEKVGPIATSIMRPGNAVLTAIRFKDGLVETVSGKDLPGLQALSEKAAAAPPEKPAEAAVTVKRHTPSCPSCVPGSVEPASEVLLSFLNEEEHESWAKDRSIVVTGGLSGNHYLLSHRHSAFAQRARRMCYDLDDHVVVHFHDWTVPPEEEVLAAKLILEHREPWLRNEATMFAALGNVMKFKNPFGDFLDGVPDAVFSQIFGRMIKGAILGSKGQWAEYAALLSSGGFS